MLLLLLNYLCCAPDRYIRDNKGKINKYDYSDRDEEYAWSNSGENTEYDYPPVRETYYPQIEDNTLNNESNRNELPSGRKFTSDRRQKPSYIIYDKPEEPGTKRQPVLKTGNYTHPDHAPKNVVKNRKKVTSYIIKNGENLTRIAKRFNLDVDDICRMNRIKNPNDIYAGMILHLVPERPERTPIKKIKKSDGTTAVRPSFEWPIKDVVSVKRDGDDGVRSIGIIITGKKGSRIYSSAAGTVKKIGQMRGFGNYVILKHPERYFTIYSNLNNIFVSEGENVGTGKMIGRLDGNMLHFQIDNSGKPEDPLGYLSKRR
ncbi:MAG: peptidoglycan DD-metalloendopeptidase family protein [Spirochaetes bacterium]|nr:peptidoglycan DD-metalloendopeptidase family protein [Spirochaetota bacterium]